MRRRGTNNTEAIQLTMHASLSIMGSGEEVNDVVPGDNIAGEVTRTDGFTSYNGFQELIYDKSKGAQ